MDELNTERRSPSSRQQKMCGAAIAVFFIAIIYLVFQEPEVTFPGDTHPKPLRASCPSVMQSVVGGGGTLVSGGGDWRYNWHDIQTDSVYSAGLESKAFVEVDCERKRSQRAELSIVLFTLIVVLSFVLWRYRDKQALEARDEQIRALRRRLGD